MSNIYFPTNNLRYVVICDWNKPVTNVSFFFIKEDYNLLDFDLLRLSGYNCDSIECHSYDDMSKMYDINYSYGYLFGNQDVFYQIEIQEKSKVITSCKKKYITLNLKTMNPEMETYYRLIL